MWGIAQYPCPGFVSPAASNRRLPRRPAQQHTKQRCMATVPDSSSWQLPADLPVPPHPYLAGHELGSFAHGTISKRLPAIVQNIVTNVKRHAQLVGPSAASEAAAIVQGLEAMAEEMRTDAPVTPVHPPPIADSTFTTIIQVTNACLQREATCALPAPSTTWWGYTWLLVECYMYVRISALLRSHSHFGATYDPFADGKLSAFTKSLPTVVDIAQAVLGVLGAKPACNSQQMKTLLFEVVQYSLWGNKTDLSMLVDVAKVDNSNMAAQISDGKPHPYLIVDEFEPLWALLSAPNTSSPRRLDLVLDNAGLELYGDLCLADVLLEFGLVDEVVLHGKLLPWFVSDVMAPDFTSIIEICSAPMQQPGTEAVQQLAGRWQQYVDAGKWQYRDHWFWTTPCPFWWTQQLAPDLYEQLRGSFLVLFKGDLNYRKLAFDCRWPVATPFATAVGPFHPAPFVSLRTLKADVMAGLQPGQGEQLDALDKDWMVNGKFGIIQARLQ